MKSIKNQQLSWLDFGFFSILVCVQAFFSIFLLGNIPMFVVGKDGARLFVRGIKEQYSSTVVK